jgi:hypothetical protein
MSQNVKQNPVGRLTKRKGFNLLSLFFFSLYFSSTFTFCTDLNKLPPTAGPIILLSPSETYGEFPLTVSFQISAIPSRGKIKKLIIDYGDGVQEDITGKIKSDKVSLTKTYERLGAFEVQVVGSDESGAAYAKTTIIVNDKPSIGDIIVARDEIFTERTSNFSPGDIVYLKALCKDTHGISKVIIDWGDGNIEETTKCTGEHRYVKEGDYTLSLLVLDDNKFAPYPLSNSVSLKISVFAGGSNPEDFPPNIFGSIEKISEPEREVFKGSDTAIGIAPFTVQIIIGIIDSEGDELDYIIVDWGDGGAQKIDPQNSISRTGSKYIFRASHKYEKAGTFVITVIAQDKKGKRAVQHIAYIHSYLQAPSIYVEASDNLGQNPSERIYTGTANINLHIITFDSAPYQVYLIAQFTHSTGQQEKLIYRIDTSYYGGTRINDFQANLTSPGKYTIEVFAVGDPIYVADAYCSESSDYFNFDLFQRVYSHYFTNLSECNINESKIKDAKAKSSYQLKFEIR